MNHPVQTPSSAHAKTQMLQYLQMDSPPPAYAQPPSIHIPVPEPPLQLAATQPKPTQKRALVVANHQHCIMSSLASLWENGKFCDASLGNGVATIMVSSSLEGKKLLLLLVKN